jgi:heme O synthase-like polyprenyltransferase
MMLPEYILATGVSFLSGAIIGAIVMSCCVVASRADSDAERIFNEFDEDLDDLMDATEDRPL